MSKHGVFVQEEATALTAPITGSCSIPVVVGTAPVNMVQNPEEVINTPILANSASQSMAQPVLDSSNEVRKIEAPATVQSRSSVIGETIGTLTGDRQQGKSKQDEQPMTFVFSPTYHFEGEAPSKEDIVEANRMSQAEFEKLMKEWMKKHKRTSFA